MFSQLKLHLNFLKMGPSIEGEGGLGSEEGGVCECFLCSLYVDGSSDGRWKRRTAQEVFWPLSGGTFNGGEYIKRPLYVFL